MAAFRGAAVDAVSLVLGVLTLPSAVVDAVQAYTMDDPFLYAAAACYAVGGIAMLAIRQRHRAGHDVLRPFFAATVLLCVGTVAFETPAGSSNLLGLAALCIVISGEVAGLGGTRLVAAAAALFPVTLFARELYRPHPLLGDVLEIVPQALSGGLGVFGLGLVLSRMVAAFARSAERARAAERAKDRFLQNMSHELRTPLNAIIGYAELLEDELDASDDLQRIQSAGRHLVTLVDDLLDLTRLEALPLERAPVDLALAVREAMVDVQPLLAPGVRYVPPAGSAVVQADAGAVRRILVALLGNAAKFTRTGEIRVVVTDGPAAVAVVDTGEGFPPEDAERIFLPFVQADDSSTRARGGSGLGLAVARGLAGRMGATLVAEGRPGQGATFTLAF
ncbi:MAG: HAMP domain-containing histidine kinase [Myxococcales bacterium]|nr:HAMP domain-containing histidine kinase [Myxococcales bacterium]